VKRNLYQRQLSEYLDGEIGLADKQAFEEQLRSDPALQAEYNAQRRLGMTLGSALPEVQVHPQRFRARMAQAVEQQSRFYITPQRAFAGAMAVALVVVSLSFGLYIYREQLIGRGNGFVVSAGAQARPVRIQPVQYQATIIIEAAAEDFFNRLLLETQLGMADPELASQVLQQTGALEGATCIDSGGLRTTAFACKLPTRQRVVLTLAGAQRLKAVADGLTGNQAALALTSSAGLTTQHDYLLAHPAGAPLPVELIFQQ
jgi:hypothetical protein